MSSKARTVQQAPAHSESLSKSKKKQLVKFSIAVLASIGILTLSILNDYLFFGWLSVSMAIILCLCAIHVIGEQQVKKQ